MTIRALIVDDEQHASDSLRRLLNEFDDIEVLAVCANGMDAVRCVHELSPTVLFLDIQMPKLDGFDVLELLGSTAPTVVFVTAHDEFAVKAFEQNALDYLLKPVSRKRLASSIERIRAQRLPSSMPTVDTTDGLLRQHQLSQAPVSRVLVREKADVFVIPCDDIIAIEAADDYVVIHTPTRTFIKQERLSKLEQVLDPTQFCRTHRSVLLNLDFLKGIETEGRDARIANMRHDKQFPISRSGYARLIERL